MAGGEGRRGHVPGRRGQAEPEKGEPVRSKKTRLDGDVGDVARGARGAGADESIVRRFGIWVVRDGCHRSVSVGPQEGRNEVRIVNCPNSISLLT